MTLDLIIGETNQIESSDKDKLENLASRVKDLNARLSDVRREQVFQRVSGLLLPWFSRHHTLSTLLTLNNQSLLTNPFSV
jgi:hypothetical protein